MRAVLRNEKDLACISTDWDPLFLTFWELFLEVADQRCRRNDGEDGPRRPSSLASRRATSRSSAPSRRNPPRYPPCPSSSALGMVICTNPLVLLSHRPTSPCMTRPATRTFRGRSRPVRFRTPRTGGSPETISGTRFRAQMGHMEPTRATLPLQPARTCTPPSRIPPHRPQKSPASRVRVLPWLPRTRAHFRTRTRHHRVF
jgi:hypothetical protein